MDGGQTNQNGQKAGEKKLSWSQPITTPVTKPVAPAAKVSTPTSAPTKSSMKRNVVTILVILVLAGVAWALIANNKHGVTTTTNTSTSGKSAATTSEPASLADGSLSIPSPQTAGLQIAVSNAVVPSPTWVVIYENNNGVPGNVLGAALFVPGRTNGSVDLLRATLSGQMYFAGEARDDGDHMYSMQTDTAVRDADGDPVFIQFQTK